MITLDIPRTIDPAATFNALVDWFHDLIVQREAPGFLIGLSGTDSVVSFLAASKAFEKAGKPERVMGVHFAPSEDFLYDHPEAEVHLWFTNEVVPWLRQQAKGTQVIVDTSIDWRYDGLRWGALADLSVVSRAGFTGVVAGSFLDVSDAARTMRLPEEQYWVVGTRNLTEDTLLNYSNASTVVSLQPLIHLWKSEILQISDYLKIPKIAIQKSCETDCICGRMRLPAQHIREVDMLLMVLCGELTENYVKEHIPGDLYSLLSKFINVQISKGNFKKSIPYTPDINVVCHRDPLVTAFEDGTLNISEFNHRKHLYVAWYYLKRLSFQMALERYEFYLKPLLDSAGQSHRFNTEITRAYFARLNAAVKFYPMDSFDELVIKCPEILKKISA